MTEPLKASRDAFLGGRIHVFQLRHGFRSGQEAVLMAASVPARARDQVLELGCGSGAASLALATRIGGVHVTGIDVDEAVLDLARMSAAENGLSERAVFHLGSAAPLEKSLRGRFAHVMFNPPFHEARSTKTEARETATHGDDALVAQFARAGLLALKDKGSLTAIIPPARVSELLAALHGKAGAITLFPLWPRAGEAARRVIVHARKGSRTPASLMPGLVLHGKGQNYTPEAERILRHGNGLSLQPQTGGAAPRC
ncbi:MAG TPA: methyltransferase [Micropepsaceae bacterium]|nr:methyltransferase [Micropepsaceae bacterium]